MNQGNTNIYNTTKRKLPSLRFEQIKNSVLKNQYELDLTFVGKKKIQSLNKKHRGIDRATDILSFPISDEMGEIYICIEIADKKSKLFGRTSENYLEFVFLHGLVHLLGYDHGEKMEKIEADFRNKFSI